MNYKEISFQTLLNALRHHWKAYLLVVAFFCLLGAGAGWWYAPRAAVSGGWEVQALNAVDFSEIREDDEYYANCLAELAAAYSNAGQYLSALSDDGTITTEQREALTALRGQLNILKEEDYQPITAALAAPNKLYLPKAAREAQIEAYEQKLSAAQLNLLQAEAAADLIRNMDAPDVGTDEINATYAALLAQAQKYTQLQRDIPLYEELLRQLREDTDILDENCREMNRLLSTAAKHLDSFLEDAAGLVEEIAAENNLIVSVEYGAAGTDTAGTAAVTLSHTHRAASGEEAFAVMTLFCALVGICGGAFFIVCLEIKYEKKYKASCADPTQLPDK